MHRNERHRSSGDRNPPDPRTPAPHEHPLHEHAVHLRESGAGYHILVALLLLLFLAQPWSPSTRVVSVLYGAIFASALFAVAPSRRLLTVGLILMIPAIAYNVFFPEADVPIQVVGTLTSLAFIVLVISIFLVRIFRHSEVSSATVSGSICVFLFMGIAWAIAYRLTLVLDPTAFSGLTNSSIAEQSTDLFYFSFVTLTTLGYGDISPVAPSARSLAMVEAIAGQLYLVVLVARFVGLYTRRSVRSPV